MADNFLSFDFEATVAGYSPSFDFQYVTNGDATVSEVRGQGATDTVAIEVERDLTVSSAQGSSKVAAFSVLLDGMWLTTDTGLWTTDTTSITADSGPPYTLLSPASCAGSASLATVELPVMGDAHITQVGFLLHCDGSDSGTSFPEFRGKTVTAYGDTQTKTSTKKFGTASARLDGYGDYLATPAHADFTFGTGDFTIEAWVYYENVPSEPHIWLVDTRSGSIGVTFGLSAITPSLTYSVNGAEGPTYSSNIPYSQWVHVALVRHNGTVTIYQNGVAGAASAKNFNVSANNGLRIGANQLNTAQTWKGYIDEVRITKGVARYTSDFAPPTDAFPEYNTILLAVSSDVQAGGSCSPVEADIDRTTYLWSANTTASGAVDAITVTNDNLYVVATIPTATGSCSAVTLQISRLLTIPSLAQPVGKGSITTVAYNVIPLTALDARGGGSIQVRAVVKAQTLQIVDATASGVIDTVFYPGVMRPAELRARGALAAVVADIATNVAILKAPVKFVVVQGAAPQRVSLQLGLYIGPGGELSVPVEYVIRDQQEGTLTAPVQFRVYEVANTSLGITYRVAAFGQPTAPVEFIINDVHYGTLSRRVEFRVFYAPAGSAGQIKATVRFCVYSDNHLFFT